MGLQERMYSVLVVSAAEAFNTALPSLLSPSVYSSVQTVSSVNAAKRELAQRQFDFVVINAPLPDDPGTHFSIDLCGTQGTVVLLLVRSALYAEIYDEVVGQGVFVLAKPISRQSFTQALSWMASARERLRKFETKTLSIEEKMKEIRMINKAKWLLISQLKMDEPQAHRYLEKQAMDRCITKRQMAEEIIQIYT